jgi:hypothetical protein
MKGLKRLVFNELKFGTVFGSGAKLAKYADS